MTRYVQTPRYEVPFHRVAGETVPKTREQFELDYHATQVNISKVVPPTRWQRFRCWLFGHTIRPSAYVDWELDKTRFVCLCCRQRWGSYHDLDKVRWRAV